MIKATTVLLRYFLFWMVFFFVDRLIFILYYSAKLSTSPFTEIAKSFIYGAWMDASMAGYLSGIPLLIFLAVWLVPGIKISSNVIKWYNGILIILFTIFTGISFNIYREWGSKVNYRAIEFLYTGPGEALASTVSSPLFSSSLVCISFILVMFFLARHIIDYNVPQRPNLFISSIFSIVIIALNILIIRGGVGVAPMNESAVYFSSKPILNHAAVNIEWALFRDMLRNKRGSKNLFIYYRSDEAQTIVNELYMSKDSISSMMLTTAQPNVVLIILESFTADVIESMGGEKGVTPNLDEIVKDGLFFSNVYASGDRTEKGIAAIISGFPAQAIQSIMKNNIKQEKLPSISQELAAKGYSTSLYYGGESEFSNMKSYLLSHGFNNIIDKASYERKDMNSKWGAYDEVVFRRQLSDLNKETQPFLSTLITLSNHEPFELPGKLYFGSSSIENKFKSTAYYTDSLLADYLTQAKKQPWYKNTLFIIVADHGHRLPKNTHENYHPARFHIPLLFYGDVIKQEYRGSEIEKIGSQTDIAATLLTQLGMESNKFPWSKDLLNKGTSDFAFYNWDNGFGFSDRVQSVSFDNVGKSVIYTSVETRPTDSLLRYGKAYMQQVYQQFLNY